MDAASPQDAGTSQDAGTQPPEAFDVSIHASATSGVAPLSVTFTASPENAGSSIQGYSWTIDGAPAGTTSMVSATLSTAGCHSIQLKATGMNGHTATAEAKVSINSGQLTGSASISQRPLDHAIIPRERASNRGPMAISGKVTRGGYAEIVATVLAGTSVRSRHSYALCDDSVSTFAMTVPIPAELTAFDVTVALARGQDQVELGRIKDLLAGDAFLINGQSNAVAGRLAADHDPSLDEGMSNFIRTFSWSATDTSATGWFVGVGTEGYELHAHVGQWALRMASVLSRAHQLPIAIINGGEGGKNIYYFFRDDANPTNDATNYGQLLQRVRAAGFADAARAMIWYQGENDPGRASWADDFMRIRNAWAQDFSHLERLYITQVHTGCTGDMLEIQEMQRKLPDMLERTGLMSTNGLDAHDGCHFFYVGGYREIGNRYAALIDRDLFGSGASNVEPPNPLEARASADGRSVIVKVRDPAAQLMFQAGAEAHFVVSVGATSIPVMSGAANGASFTLTLAEPLNGSATVSYRAHEQAGPWVIDQKSGIGLLAFAGLPVTR